MIEHYWVVAWDLPDPEEHTQETLPDPNVQVVFEKGNSNVYGIMTGKFSRVLKGTSHVFGIRFAPGVFRPFLGCAVASIANKNRRVGDVFGPDIDELEAILVSAEKWERMVETTNAFFQERTPPIDDKVLLAQNLVRTILEGRDLRTVDDLMERVRIGKRMLQRLFHEYVGVSPKWVIRRYRLHEAVDRLRAGERPDFAQLALDLGYFDQAHMINDFHAIIGYSPKQVQKNLYPP